MSIKITQLLPLQLVDIFGAWCKLAFSRTFIYKGTKYKKFLLEIKSLLLQRLSQGVRSGMHLVPFGMEIWGMLCISHPHRQIAWRPLLWIQNFTKIVRNYHTPGFLWSYCIKRKKNYIIETHNRINFGDVYTNTAYVFSTIFSFESKIAVQAVSEVVTIEHIRHMASIVQLSA